MILYVCVLVSLTLYKLYTEKQSNFIKFNEIFEILTSLQPNYHKIIIST